MSVFLSPLRKQLVFIRSNNFYFILLKYFSIQHSVFSSVGKEPLYNPLHFILYISSLGQIICGLEINLHWYTEDSQFCVPVKTDSHSQICQLKARSLMLINEMLVSG